jgi:GT2 family glycosyltransferase
MDSILVLTKDKYLLIRECLESLLRTVNRTDVEIFVGDTGSTDSRVFKLYEEFEPRFFGRFRVVKLPYYQFSQNNNALASLASGENLVFLNNDTIALEGWLDALKLGLDRHGVGIVGPKLLYAFNNRIQHAGIEFLKDGPLQFLGYHPFKGRRPEMPEANYDKFMPAVTGACLAIKSDLFHRINGFDPKFREEAQDADLCLNAHRWGAKSLYVPSAVLYHLENGTRTCSEDNQDRQYFIRKWHRYISDHFFKEKFQSVAADTAEATRRSNLKYVLFHRTRARGDVFASSALLKQYKRQNPETHITYKTQFPDVIDALPFVDRVLGEEEPDDFIYDSVLRPSYEDGEWKRFGHPWLQEMARSVGVFLSERDARPIYFFSKFDEPARCYYRNFAAKKPYIVTTTGAGWRERTWNLIEWEKLVGALSLKGITTFQIGSSKNDEWIDGAYHLMDRDLHENLAILESASALVTVDSYPYHLGLAVGLPIVLLTCKSSSHTVWIPSWVTEIRNHTAEKTPLPGCRFVGCRLKVGEGLDNVCPAPILKDLSFAPVLEAVLGKIDGRQSQHTS